MKRGRIRFLGQIALAILAGTSFLLTLAWRDWIEALFRFGPDEHDGSLELVVSSVLLAATVALTASARAEWRISRSRRNGNIGSDEKNGYFA